MSLLKQSIFNLYIRSNTSCIVYRNFIGMLSIYAIISDLSIRIFIHPFLIWFSIHAIATCITILKSHFSHPCCIVVLTIPSGDSFVGDIGVAKIRSSFATFTIWSFWTHPRIRINCSIVSIGWTECKVSSGSFISWEPLSTKNYSYKTKKTVMFELK